MSSETVCHAVWPASLAVLVMDRYGAQALDREGEDLGDLVEVVG